MRIRAYCCAFLAANLLLADGGVVQFRRQSGSLSITLFGAPAPLRAGVADFSVLVETIADTSAALDASVELRLSKPGEQPIALPATRAQAANKLLYAAQPRIPSAGVWQADVQVTRNGMTFDASGEVHVLPQESPMEVVWPYLALVPVGVLFFLVNQWLKSRSANKVSARSGSH